MTFNTRDLPLRLIVFLTFGLMVSISEAQKGGVTALMAASLKGDLETVQVLLAKGAEVNARTDNGKTALDLAEAKWTRGRQSGLSASWGHSLSDSIAAPNFEYGIDRARRSPRQRTRLRCLLGRRFQG